MAVVGDGLLCKGVWLPSLLLPLLAWQRPCGAVSYAEQVVTARVRENLVQLMGQPFVPLEYSTEAYDWPIPV